MYHKYRGFAEALAWWLDLSVACCWPTRHLLLDCSSHLSCLPALLYLWSLDCSSLLSCLPALLCLWTAPHPCPVCQPSSTSGCYRQIVLFSDGELCLNYVSALTGVITPQRGWSTPIGHFRYVQHTVHCFVLVYSPCPSHYHV